MMQPAELSQYIKSEALGLGFDVCGIAQADAVPQHVVAEYNKVIYEGRHATMSYLERNCDKRFNPMLLVPRCRSIVCVALNYYPAVVKEDGLHLARYAQGQDYHKVVKEKLYALLKRIDDVHPVSGRAFCDTAPVLERFWAVQAGIGWIGKNHQLIVPGAGSHFFLGELFIDVELEYDAPLERDFCGDCEKCLHNCPVGALSSAGFDARRCLSYLTIEHRGELPDNIGEKMGDCFYGCDRCSSCCPHNRFAIPTALPQFLAKDELLAMTDTDWFSLDKERYNRLFSDSAVERCGYDQLMRNIRAILCKD